MSLRTILKYAEHRVTVFFIKSLCLKIEGVQMHEMTAFLHCLAFNFAKQNGSQPLSAILLINPNDVDCHYIPTIHDCKTSSDDIAFLIDDFSAYRFKQFTLRCRFHRQIIFYQLIFDKLIMMGYKMPMKYVAEMFCDRLAACKVYLKEAYTDASAYDYFVKSKSHLLIHPDTSEEIERMLWTLKEEGEDAAFAYVRNRLLDTKR